MRPRRWIPARNDLDELLFVGATALLRRLDSLVIRPRRWWRETLLPIIFLVRGTPAAASPSTGIADRLHQSRGVPHSRISGRRAGDTSDAGQSESNSIRDLLNQIVADLVQRSGSRRPLRFPHYSLAVWLVGPAMGHDAAEQPDQFEQRIDDALQKFIEVRYRLHGRTPGPEASLVNELPWWVRIPIWFVPPLGVRVMRAFWRPPRWIAGTGIAVAYGSRSFRGLARKVIEQGSGQQHGIGQADIDRLLVDAFMEDLRRAYRRTPLFLLGLRRSTYPVLLVDDATAGTPALRLVDLISASRADFLRGHDIGPGKHAGERAYFHPLLVVVQADEGALREVGAPDGWSAGPDSHAIADVEYYYRAWYRGLTSVDPVWFVPLRVPEPGSTPGLRTELARIPLPSAPRPVALLAVACLAVAACSATLYHVEHTRCGAWYWEPDLHARPLENRPDQCIGLGSDDFRFFADVNLPDQDVQLAAELDEVETAIHKANEQAVQDPRYRTVVYLSELSSRDDDDYRTELEQLRGIAVKQDEAMVDHPVRILLANAGDGMDYGAEAARAIADEAGGDPTIVAVLGLGVSRDGTRDAIRVLSESAHLPMIGTSLTATDLAKYSGRYYHQVDPTNEREAEVGAFYAATVLGADNAVIYSSSDDRDLYSRDLADQAQRAFGKRMRVSAYVVRIESRQRPRSVLVCGRHDLAGVSPAPGCPVG